MDEWQESFREGLRKAREKREEMEDDRFHIEKLESDLKSLKEKNEGACNQMSQIGHAIHLRNQEMYKIERILYRLREKKEPCEGCDD